MSELIYLDYAATTPLDHRVVESMSDFLSASNFANSSSSHQLGKIATEVVEKNRSHVADLINVDSSEILWTSGATESNNLAIIGTALANKHFGSHIIVLTTEHESVLNSCKHLERLGFNITYLIPDQNGILDINKLEYLITKETLLISVMLVNNETGVIQDIEGVSEVTKKAGIILHVDASQAVGKLPIDPKKMGISLMSLSAHKMYGPKGIGALYIDRTINLDISPILYGGAQEKGMRPGTLATHQIVGFGEACKIAAEDRVENYKHAEKLRNIFLEKMGSNIQLNFHLNNTSPYIMSIYFPHMHTSTRQQLSSSSELIVSSRSACSSHKKQEFSHVLKSLGFNENTITNTFRISIGKQTTIDEILLATVKLQKILKDK